MSSHTLQSAALHALLIGVNYYLPGDSPEGFSYPSLGGCVRDITLVEQFLTQKLETPRERIRKLTSSATGDSAPSEPRERWPTYENIISAFREVRSAATPGDLVYIHYCGHGGRVPTLLPEVKGERGLDETLVPMDIARAEAAHLRDVELAHLLREMVGKGLVVTLVLDSCHSGGATRGAGNVAVRGVAAVDRTHRPRTSMVVPRAELAATWRGLLAGVGPGGGLGMGLLTEATGYVLLAACRPSESAYEYAFEGEEMRGVLTYWLIDSLRQFGPRLTYKQIYDRILGKIHSQFRDQTPMLIGEGDRLVFGSERMATPYAVLVMDADATRQRVRLQAGRAQGVGSGSQFAIYSHGETELDRPEGRLALVEVEDAGATISWANVTARFKADAIEPGAQAVLLDPGRMRLCRNVRVVARDVGGCEPSALSRFEEALAVGGSRWVQLAQAGQEVDYQVVVNARGEYEIWDPAGHALENLRPAIEARADDGAARVVNRLVHLSKYQSVQQLDNNDRTSPLTHRLTTEVFKLPEGFDPEAARLDMRPSDASDGPLIFSTGEWLCLRIRNGSSQVLNVTVLDLQPDWGISQVFPSTEGKFFEPLDGGDKLDIPFRTYLPPGYAEGVDVLKVFATVGAANFRWLELPPLDSPPARTWRSYAKPSNALEQLLAILSAERLLARHVNVTNSSSHEWVTAQVVVRQQSEDAS